MGWERMEGVGESGGGWRVGGVWVREGWQGQR